MSASPRNHVSIILCTCGRPEPLRATIDSIIRSDVPSGWDVELLIVDNNPSEQTAHIARGIRSSSIRTKYIAEPRRGKGNAYNAGFAAARGDLLLSTDDDVRVPGRWIAPMCEPIINGIADGVAGGLRTAPHLVRDWMELRHHFLLATTMHMTPGPCQSMTGANMAFSRRVLDKIPRFDPELGPGALGYMEESLFSMQMVEAGFRIVTALDVMVDHCFDESRLSRKFFVKAIERGARSSAYVAYHWEHREISSPLVRMAHAWAKLQAKRVLRRAAMKTQLIPEWEQRSLHEYFFHRQYAIESRRERNYGKHGLVRRPAAVDLKVSAGTVRDLSC